MAKLEYVDEATFKKEDIEFDDKHLNLIEELRKPYHSELWSKCSPIMVGSNKKSLIFVVNLGDKEKDRVKYECGDDAYRITVEKIKND